MKKQLIISVDGHDGSGKTTIAKLLAEKIGGKYVKPFSGDVGDLIVWSYKKKNFQFLEELALNAIENATQIHRGARILIFDRHWLTISTLLPKRKLSHNFIKPLTFLCWANVDTTLERLFVRKDDQENAWDNKKYCNLYYDLGVENNTIIVDTSASPNPQTVVDEIIKNQINYYLDE